MNRTPQFSTGLIPLLLPPLKFSFCWTEYVLLHFFFPWSVDFLCSLAIFSSSWLLLLNFVDFLPVPRPKWTQRVQDQVILLFFSTSSSLILLLRTEIFTWRSLDWTCSLCQEEENLAKIYILKTLLLKGDTIAMTRRGRGEEERGREDYLPTFADLFNQIKQRNLLQIKPQAHS